MRVEKLIGPPMSGSIKERWFDASGKCSWFRFQPGEGDAWAGAFGNGEGHKSSAVVFDHDRTAFVIACGQGYAINLDTGQMAYKSKCDYLWNALAIPGKPLVVACDDWSLYLLGTDRELWESDLIALDGIILDSASPDEVVGKCWQHDGWYAFVFRHADRSCSIGPLLTTHWSKFSSA